MNWLDSSIWQLGIALGIGLLIGAERERSKGTGPKRAAAGIRTFALVSLLGGIAAILNSPILLGVCALCVGALAALSYYRSNQSDPGLTTEVALLLTFFLGILSQTQPGVAAALAAIVALLLFFRGRIHRFVQNVLTEEELNDILLFGGATLVILPLLPNNSMGPFDFFNPRRFWELVVLVLIIQAAMHVVVRLVGSRLGFPISGFFGGFISSSGTIANLGSKAKKQPALFRPVIAGAAFSNVSTVIQLSALLAIASPAIFKQMAVSLSLAGAAAIGYGIFMVIGVDRKSHDDHKPPGRVFSFKAALTFAVIVFAVLFASSAANQWIGTHGLLISSSIAGFADVHAVAISVSDFASSGKVLAEATTIPILAAFTTNTITKIAMAFWGGNVAFAIRLLPGLLLVLAGAWLGLLV